MARNNILHKVSFWLALGVVLDFFLFNVSINDRSAWIAKLAPTLKGMPYPHLGTALMMYMVSVLFIVLAFAFFSGFCVRFLRVKQSIPVGLQGYWLLSLIAFTSLIIPVLALKYHRLADIRIGASLNILFTLTFFVTGLIANINSND